MGAAYLRELDRLAAEDKAQFETAKGIGLSIVLAQVRGGVPYLGGFNIVFAPELPSRLAIKRIVCPGEDCPSGSYILFLGKQDAPRLRLREINEPGAPLLSTSEVSSQLVAAEIEAHSDGVGPPIVTLTLDLTGVSWANNETGCPLDAETGSTHR